MSLVHSTGSFLSGAFAAAPVSRPDPRARSVGASVGAVAVALLTFVVSSLALSSVANLIMGATGVFGNSLLQGASYFAVAALAMLGSRRFADLFFESYHGRWVFYSFVGIDIVLIALAVSALRMDVDYLVTLSRMVAVCFFAYLQFWKRDHLDSAEPAQEPKI